jgi:type II secretory pathway component PulK
MTERGSALLTVLWLLVILSTAGAAVLSKARFGHLVSSNRLVLRRAEWAQEACIEILMARQRHLGAGDRPQSSVLLDTIQLGRGTWCHANIEVAGTRMDLNTLTPDLLRQIFGDARLVDALLDWADADTVSRPAGAERSWYLRQGRRPPRDGPVADIWELALVRGFDSVRVGRLATFLTTGGDGTIDPNEAPRELLRLLPGLDLSGVEALVARRGRDKRMTSIDELLAALPPASRERAQANYLELAQRVDLSGRTLRVDVDAGVLGWRPLAHARLTMRASDGRLAVLRRQMQ